MPEGICQSLARNAKDFIYNVLLESVVSSLAFHDKFDRGVAVQIAGDPLYRSLKLRVGEVI
jgi:hypothetical protein